MPLTRELSVTWGNITLGGGTARQITDYTIHEEDYTTGYFECAFITTAADAAALETEIETLGIAFRTPRLDLTVTLGGQEILHRWQSDNTGLDTDPTIAKNGDPADTSRSRHFRVRVGYGLPADVVETDFRRGSNINVSIGPNGIRTLTVTGSYTANSDNGTTGAYEQYSANITAYALSCIERIDPFRSTTRWELINEPTIERNETDKIMSFSISYREIIHEQAIGVYNFAAIVDPSMIFSVSRMTPGDSDSIFLAGASGIGASVGSGGGVGSTVVSDSPGSTTTGSRVARPSVLTVQYSCTLDKNVNQDPQQLYLVFVRPLILKEATQYSGGPLILVAEAPDFGDVYSNRLSATITFHTYTSPILSQTVTVQDSTNYGKILRPVWDGDPFSFYEYQGAAIRTKTILEEREEISSNPNVMQVVDRLTGAVKLDDANWMLVSRTPKGDVKKRGLPGLLQPYVATLAIETVFQFRKKRRGGTASSGGGSTTTGGDSVAT